MNNRALIAKVMLFVSEMVCTTKRDIYLNICDFKKAQCRHDIEILVEIEPTFTPCEGGPGSKYYPSEHATSVQRQPNVVQTSVTFAQR